MNICALIFAVIGLAVAAQTRLNGVVLGQPVSIPVLWLVAAAMVLLMLAAVLILARLLIRDGLRLRPGMVGA